MSDGRLTKRAVEQANKTGRLCDARGLYLQVKVGKRRTSKTWVLRYERNGRERGMGLGGYPDVSLEMARARRDEQRQILRSGRDPIEVRKAARLAWIYTEPESANAAPW
jgi:hypothetical protein